MAVAPVLKPSCSDFPANSSSIWRIKGVFLGLGDDGCLQVQVGNRSLDYYSVESITFPVDDLL